MSGTPSGGPDELPSCPCPSWAPCKPVPAPSCPGLDQETDLSPTDTWLAQAWHGTGCAGDSDSERGALPYLICREESACPAGQAAGPQPHRAWRCKPREWGSNRVRSRKTGTRPHSHLLASCHPALQPSQLCSRTQAPSCTFPSSRKASDETCLCLPSSPIRQGQGQVGGRPGLPPYGQCLLNDLGRPVQPLQHS